MKPSWIHHHPALAGAPPEEGNWNHLGGLFPTPRYIFLGRAARSIRKLNSGPASLNSMMRWPVRAQ